jgi:hypothetical protein
MRFGHGARQLESRNCLFPGDGRKAFEKLVERIARLEVVVQGLHRHSRTHEDRSTAKNLGVAVYDGRVAGHDDFSIAPRLFQESLENR